MLQKIKRKIFTFIIEQMYKRVDTISTFDIKDRDQDAPNLVLITFDSCRYDSFVTAKTPFLDSMAKAYSAQTQATYTLPAHTSFFNGLLPLVNEPIPYLNRFIKQLVTMDKFGAERDMRLDGNTVVLPSSDKNIIDGLNEYGYYSVGSAGAVWFLKESLTKSFQDFKFERQQSAKSQVNFILENISSDKCADKPFFAFMNLMETHTPFMHYGEDRDEYEMTARKYMKFPPIFDEEQHKNLGKKLHTAQIEAVEYLDEQMSKFIPQLPENTIIVLTADHGECFGEDGYWGHGVYHPKVMEVPMMVFKLNDPDLLKLD